LPIYEFICEKCEKRFEEFFRSASERRKVACPKCKGERVRKAFSVFGLSSGGKKESGGSSCSSCSRSSCSGCRR